jgi:hypothetical protein
MSVFVPALRMLPPGSLAKNRPKAGVNRIEGVGLAGERVYIPAQLKSRFATYRQINFLD